MKYISIFLTICFAFLAGEKTFAQSDNTLWYKQPAQYFEESLVLGNGKMGASVFSGTADLAMIRECFEQTIKASRILNIDADFRVKLEQALARLHLYQVGEKGNLQEWYYDWEDADPKHRHQSHLFGLFPGHQIPDLFISIPNISSKVERTSSFSSSDMFLIRVA